MRCIAIDPQQPLLKRTQLRKMALWSILPNLKHWPSALFGVRAPKRLRRWQAAHQRRQRLLLKTLLDAKKLSEHQLAARMNVDTSSIAKVLAGDMALPPAWLATLIDILGPAARRLKTFHAKPGRRTPPRLKFRIDALREQARDSQNALRTLLRNENKTLKSIAAALGVDRSAVSNVITGRMPLPNAWTATLRGLLTPSAYTALLHLSQGYEGMRKTEGYYRLPA
jgi:transcriptional regulator with XRE-family HTH domain